MMRARLPLAALGIAAGLACAERRQTIALPADVAYVAVLEPSEEHGGLPAGVLERANAGPLRFERGATAMFAVLGFTERDVLAACPTATPESVEGSKVFPRSGCAPALSRPTFSVAIDPDGDPAQLDPGPLTSDLFDSCCPIDLRTATIGVALRCSSLRCGSPLSVRRCGFDVDLSPCPTADETVLGRIKGVISPSGDVCAEVIGAGPACTPAAAEPGTVATLSCAGCPIEIQHTTDELHVDVRSIEVVPGSPLYHPGVRPSYFPWPAQSEGYLANLAVLTDRVVVTAYPELRDSPVCGTLGGGVPWRFHFFDLETTAPIGTATAPTCLLTLTGAPAGDGLYGASVRTNEVRLHRWDREGRLLSETSTTARATAFPVALATATLGTGANVIALLVGINTPVSDLPDVLLLYDPITLRLIRSIRVAETESPGSRGVARAMTTAGPGLLAIAQDAGDMVQWFDLDSGAEVDRASLGDNVDAFGIEHRPGTDEVIVPIAGSRNGVYLSGRGVNAARGAFPLERAAAPVKTRIWSAHRERALVGLVDFVDELEHRASIALYDPTRAAFSSGLRAIGGGTISQMHEDNKKRMWLLLPWSGLVVRVEALGDGSR